MLKSQLSKKILIFIHKRDQANINSAASQIKIIQHAFSICTLSPSTNCLIFPKQMKFFLNTIFDMIFIDFPMTSYLFNHKLIQDISRYVKKNTKLTKSNLLL